MVEIRDKIAASVFVLPQVLGVGEALVYINKTIFSIAHVAFKALQELYFYARGKEFKLLDTKLEMHEALDLLNYRLSCLALAILTIIPLGGIIRYSRAKNAEKIQDLLAKARVEGNKDALDQLKEASKLGSGEADHELFLATLGQDEKEAMAHLNKAVAKGYLTAIIQLGEHYHLGTNGIAKDLEKAITLYKKAAYKEGPACNNLGLVYCEKEGQFTLAHYWYRKGMDKKCERAKLNVAYDLLEGKGVDKDEAEALKLLKELSESPSGVQGEAKKEYAVCLYNGIGIEKSQKDEILNAYLRSDKDAWEGFQQWVNESLDEGKVFNLEQLHAWAKISIHHGNKIAQRSFLKRAAENGHNDSLRDLNKFFPNVAEKIKLSLDSLSSAL